MKYLPKYLNRQVQIVKTASEKILEMARDCLKKEGWIIKDDILTNKDTGEIFKFEILLRSPF